MGSKENKVIDLFNSSILEENEDVKYSQLLQDLIKPFENDFPEDYTIDDVLEFAISVWNFSNVNKFIPPEEFEEAMSPAANLKGSEKDIFQKMFHLKETEFDRYERFFIGFNLKEENDDLRLVVNTGNMEAFMGSIEEKLPFDRAEYDFDENYVNRYAVVLKPQRPFFDWINALYPDDPIDDIPESSVYLVDDTIDDLEKWLRKKFDRFFVMELGDWHQNKKEWPQKRNYKMFREWFSISWSSMVYDLEKRPVLKSDM